MSKMPSIFHLPETLAERLGELQKLHAQIASDFAVVSESRNRQDRRDQALLVLMARVLKYFEAYLLLAREGYGEPAATLVRAIYEGCLWMRWCLDDPPNADRYFAVKPEVTRQLSKLHKRGLLRMESLGSSTQSKLTEVLQSKVTGGPPHFEDMSIDCGMADLHALFYPTLCWMAHGSYLHLGERSIKEVNWQPDMANIEPFVFVAKTFFDDCWQVYREWVQNRRIHPVPDICEGITAVITDGQPRVDSAVNLGERADRS
jgi:hypothetical protein